MRVRWRFVIGCTLLILGMLCIFSGVVIVSLAKVFPGIFNPYFSTLFAFLEASGIIIALVGNLMAQVFGFTLRDLFKRSKKENLVSQLPYFPFEVINEPGTVLPALLPGPGLIPDYKLPYHRRIAERNVTEELRTQLFNSKRILVTGVAGIGKTRETGKLLSDLIDEGFTLLRAKNDAQFDTKIDFPENLRHGLVFLFDDMHQRCADPSVAIPEKARSYDFLDSVRLFLDRAVSRFTPSDIFVVFIARSDVDAWNYLQFPSHPIWNHVTHYQLPYPSVECQQEFLLSIAARLELDVDRDIARQLAELNDRTFRNLVQNLYRAKLSNRALSLDTFTPKQGQTWLDRCAFLQAKYPTVVPALFDALGILSEIGLRLHTHLVVELATSLILGIGRENITLPIRWLIRRRVLRVASELQANGDLVVDLQRDEYAVQEAMLVARQSRVDAYGVVEAIFRHADQLDQQFDFMIRLADYAVSRTLNLTLGIRIVNRVLRSNPNHARARATRSWALWLCGLLDYALKDADIALQTEPRNPLILNLRGIIYGELEKYDLARHDFDEASQLDPNETYHFKNLAQLYILQGDLLCAEQFLSRAIERHPEDVSLYVARARILEKLGKRNQAEADLAIALEKNPKWLSVRVARARYFLADSQFDRAEEEIRRAIEVAPRSVEPYLVRADLFTQQDKIEEAERDINEAIQLFPYDGRFYYARATIYLRRKDYPRAVQELDKAIMCDSRNPKYFARRGSILRRIGALNLAYHDLQQALVLDPNNASAMLDLSRVYARWGKLGDALETASRTLELSPDSGDAYHVKAHIYEHQKKFQLAKAAFDSAISVAPKDPRHYRCLGQFELNSLKSRAAIRDLAIARNLNPEDIDNHIAYINSIDKFGQHKRVKETYLKEISKQPENPVLLTSYAYLCRLEHDLDEADKYVNRVLNCPMTDPMVPFYCFWILSGRKKFRLIWKLYRCLAAGDPALIWDYTLHLYDSPRFPSIMRSILNWALERGVFDPKLEIQKRLIWLSRLTRRSERISIKDLLIQS